jgi:hypothetical protein
MENYLLKFHRNGRNDYIYQAQKFVEKIQKETKESTKKKTQT